MIDVFRDVFGAAGKVRIFRAPGRVNLIGEHTDYNLGFVMPIALDLATCVATAPNREGRLRIYSEAQRELHEWSVSDLHNLQPALHWTDYPIGVAQQLMRAGFPIKPANLLIRSTVPVGSGLSSSAALEVSTALAFLLGRKLDRLELAKLCQRAEVEFVGMPCGIMDQYISVFGREHAAIRIDCRSREHEAVKLPRDVVILAVNTMVKHELAASAYRERTQECATAVKMIRQRFPQVESLRDVTVEQLAEVESTLPAVVARRARHVVTEDARVEAFVAAHGDLERMGQLLVESHRSLQFDYEVSCPELDFLVDRALDMEGVLGARMTGGGFGGCMVTMLRPPAVKRFRREVTAAYQKKFGVEPQVYVCRPSRGAGEVRRL
jgi:galactokinase